MEADPFNLQRFIEAQKSTYNAALHELENGKKRTHWMWFIFPQLRKLGHSPTAKFYGITSLEEARAYFAHDMLGPRLIDCTNAVLACNASSLSALFGSPDDKKFRSCMTLFEQASASPKPYFTEA